MFLNVIQVVKIANIAGSRLRRYLFLSDHYLEFLLINPLELLTGQIRTEGSITSSDSSS